MAWTKDDVQEALRSVIDPELHRDLVSLGAIRRIADIKRASGIAPGEDVEQCLPHAGQYMHMLVAIDEIRRAAERLLEGIELAHDLRRDLGARRRGRRGRAGDITRGQD